MEVQERLRIPSEVWQGSEAHKEVWGYGGSPGGVCRIERPTRRSGWGWEVHPEVREGPGDPPEGPQGVARPSQWARWGQLANPEVWVGSGGPTKDLGGISRPICRSGGLGDTRGGWEGSGGYLRGPGVVKRPT